MKQDFFNMFAEKFKSIDSVFLHAIYCNLRYAEKEEDYSSFSLAHRDCFLNSVVLDAMDSLISRFKEMEKELISLKVEAAEKREISVPIQIRAKEERSQLWNLVERIGYKLVVGVEREKGDCETKERT